MFLLREEGLKAVFGGRSAGCRGSKWSMFFYKCLVGKIKIDAKKEIMLHCGCVMCVVFVCATVLDWMIMIWDIMICKWLVGCVIALKFWLARPSVDHVKRWYSLACPTCSWHVEVFLVGVFFCTRPSMDSHEIQISRHCQINHCQKEQENQQSRQSQEKHRQQSKVCLKNRLLWCFRCWKHHAKFIGFARISMFSTQILFEIGHFLWAVPQIVAPTRRRGAPRARRCFFFGRLLQFLDEVPGAILVSRYGMSKVFTGTWHLVVNTPHSILWFDIILRQLGPLYAPNSWKESEFANCVCCVGYVLATCDAFASAKAESDFRAFRPPRWLTSKNGAWFVNRVHQIKVSPVIVADDSDLDVHNEQQ